MLKILKGVLRPKFRIMNVLAPKISDYNTKRRVEMKKVFIVLVATTVLIGGCSALVSVGDSNTNSVNHTNNFNKKDGR